MILKYFAYGSNMLHQRLVERVPSCRLIDKVCLTGYSLNYHVTGMDGSGKCNIIETGYSHDQVYGVVFEMSAAQKYMLDAAEGRGYAICQLKVRGEQAEHEVFAYIGKPRYLDKSIRPFSWYKEIVVHGARSHGFPEEYINQLQQVDIDHDPDQERSAKHMRIIQLSRTNTGSSHRS